VFVLARVAAILYLAVRVWLLAAARGQVERTEAAGPKVVDELAGPMAGAPDRVLVRLD
jgi:hypothetical protein